MVDAAKDTADRIDSGILLDVLREAGAKLDAQPVPLVGRYYWNPETNSIEPIQPLFSGRIGRIEGFSVYGGEI